MVGQDMGKSLDRCIVKGKRFPLTINPALDFLMKFPKKLNNSLKPYFNNLKKWERDFANVNSSSTMGIESCTAYEANLERQLQTWKENSFWVDQPPEIKISVPKGSLCNLNVNLKVGLPPDAIYNIVTDPENRRVFKNIKEVISRKVLIDEGLRQVVEVEQTGLWRFLWWSGTISLHVIVEQNRENYTVKFKQNKTGFMEKFEGCWKVEPLYVDEAMCLPYKPKTWADYESCTRGKGRVGSIVSLNQLIQPALVPPPPLSWYVRGITTRTTEMFVADLLAEAARLRTGAGGTDSRDEFKPSTAEIETNCDSNLCERAYSPYDIKKRWNQRRKRRKTNRKFLPDESCRMMTMNQHIAGMLYKFSAQEAI